MARTAKKETVLTPEEKLVLALVPEAEQPYQVPENWCWTKIGALSTLHRGVSYKKNDAHSVKQANDCLVMRGGNIGEGYIDIDADNVYVDLGLVSKDQLVKKNDIIIVASTGSTKVIGRAGISSDDYSDVAFGAFLMAVRPSQKAIPRYMDYYFQSDLYRNRIRDLASGVNINNIRADYITESPYPLPPLAEQQRIVDRIESLFAKLDEAKEKAQAVVDGFEDRKAAILHKAFTGELTSEWRKKNRVGMDTWVHTTLGEIATFHQGVQVPVEEQFDEEAFDRIRFIRIVDYTQGNEPSRYIASKAVRNGALVSGAEIVMVRYGASAGFVGDGIEGAIANNMFTISVEDDVREYVKLVLKSPQFFSILNNSGGSSAMPALNFKVVSAVELSLPPVSEQKEIIRLVQMPLLIEQQATEKAECVIDQIDTMKKSILARAFRGELGTNDPSDESAEELLKRIL